MMVYGFRGNATVMWDTADDTVREYTLSAVAHDNSTDEEVVSEERTVSLVIPPDVPEVVIESPEDDGGVPYGEDLHVTVRAEPRAPGATITSIEVTFQPVWPIEGVPRSQVIEGNRGTVTFNLNNPPLPYDAEIVAVATNSLGLTRRTCIRVYIAGAPPPAPPSF